MKRVLINNTLFLLLYLSFLNVPGQTRDSIKENKLQSELYTIDPSLVQIFAEGTKAMDGANFHLADSLYSIVVNKAPTFVPALRRAGGVKVEMGDVTSGLALCEKAVEISRSSDNLISLASALVNAASKNPNGDNSVWLGHALEILREGRGLPSDDDYEYNALMCQVALQLDAIPDFKTATNYLLKNHSDKMATHYFGALLAAYDEDWIQAEKEIIAAKEMGLEEGTFNQFMDSGIKSKLAIAKYKKFFIWLLIIWALGFVVLYITGIILSNYTLKSIEKEFKATASTKLAITLRSIYKKLISFAGVYYYFSLPIVLVLVIVVVGGLTYMFFALGHIPIKLVLLLVIGGGVSIYAMIRSLLLKVDYSDPGRELKESEAPALFALAKEVAGTMNTRAIDEIRITHETDLAVYEKGTKREKIQDKGRRILILGTGVLKDFKLDAFKAVLAHEYGHFSHRDTAGGDVALRVRNDMNKYIQTLYFAGQTVWWNLAYQFLRLYHFIFYRISNGATRLQEILADRVAAQTYGANAFENGLTYVIKSNIEFVKLAKHEIEDAKKVKRSFSNLYSLPGNFENEIEIELKQALNRETTNDDTHPSPVDRFRFIQGLGSGRSNLDSRTVKDLFLNWDALTAEMTKLIEDSWKNSGKLDNT